MVVCTKLSSQRIERSVCVCFVADNLIKTMKEWTSRGSFNLGKWATKTIMAY